MMSQDIMPKNITNTPFIEINELTFHYPNSESSDLPIFSNLSAKIEKGSVVLLTGLNGAGKSTLLSILAGHHLLKEDSNKPSLKIAGRSPFHDPASVHTTVLLNDEFPLTLDLKVRELLDQRTPWVDLAREKELMELLQVDPAWRMHRVSEGQKRRVQLLLSLRKKVDLLLLDEVTTHLDLLVRADFLSWTKQRATVDGLTVIYATHILDGLWNAESLDRIKKWPTDLFFLGKSLPPSYRSMSSIPEIQSSGSGHEMSFYSYIEKLFRSDLIKQDPS